MQAVVENNRCLVIAEIDDQGNESPLPAPIAREHYEAAAQRLEDAGMAFESLGAGSIVGADGQLTELAAENVTPAQRSGPPAASTPAPRKRAKSALANKRPARQARR